MAILWTILHPQNFKFWKFIWWCSIIYLDLLSQYPIISNTVIQATTTITSVLSHKKKLICQKKLCIPWMHAHYIPGLFLNVYDLRNLIVIEALWPRKHNHHFTDKETEAERFSDLPEVAVLITTRQLNPCTRCFSMTK